MIPYRIGPCGGIIIGTVQLIQLQRRYNLHHMILSCPCRRPCRCRWRWWCWCCCWRMIWHDLVFVFVGLFVSVWICCCGFIFVVKLFMGSFLLTWFWFPHRRSSRGSRNLCDKTERLFYDTTSLERQINQLFNSCTRLIQFTNRKSIVVHEPLSFFRDQSAHKIWERMTIFGSKWDIIRKSSTFLGFWNDDDNWK